MCNFFRVDTDADAIAQQFGADKGADVWDNGYVAPGRFAPIVTGVKERRIVPMLWGYPPPPNAQSSRNALVTNVRNLESPFWIGNLRHSELRCLVPVTRFQEWAGEKGHKKQIWFDVPSQPLFAFAGIWRDTGEMPVFAFLTTEPNAMVRSVHPKAMPVILHPEDYQSWLSDDWKIAKKLVQPFPSQLMAMTVNPDQPV
jgi:putative SOS response-associated peptidase YedK